MKYNNIEYYSIIDFRNNKMDTSLVNEGIDKYAIFTYTNSYFSDNRLKFNEYYIWSKVPSNFCINFKYTMNTPVENIKPLIIAFGTGTNPPLTGIRVFTSYGDGGSMDSYYTADNIFPTNSYCFLSQSNLEVGYNTVHIYNIDIKNGTLRAYVDGNLKYTYTNTSRNFKNFGIGMYDYSKSYFQNRYTRNELYWLTLTDVPSSIVPVKPYVLDEKDNEIYGYEKISTE